MGNTTVWKPASSAIYSNYMLMKLFQAAGLPDGVINFLPTSGPLISDTALVHPDLAGVHFTGSGSTAVFRSLWKGVASHLDDYRSYPRLVGETGGKDFVMVHPSADPTEVAVALIRGAFEYQGQKCSAASQAYIPKSLWPQVKEQMLAMVSESRVGDPQDFGCFMNNAVIDHTAFDTIMGYINRAAANSANTIICGGKGDATTGYFIEPTIIETTDPKSETMVNEIFGPVLTVFVYEDSRYSETLSLCDETSPYGLTGSIFARDRKAIADAEQVLQYAAGNFYINHKPTGAVVSMQPFGGARASGTNDKAGSYLNLLRWVSSRAVKELYNPPHDFRYPFMQ